MDASFLVIIFTQALCLLKNVTQSQFIKKSTAS